MKPNRNLFIALLTLPACLAGNLFAQNEASGTLTVDGETAEMQFGYADVYEGDITVILSDSEVPREAIPDRTYDLAADGQFRGIVFSVSLETRELQSGGWYELTNAVHFHPILNQQGNIGEPSLTVSKLDEESLSGSISTGGAKDVDGHEISYEARFTVSLKKVPLEVTVTGVDNEAAEAYEGWCRALFDSDFETLKRYATGEVAEMMAEADPAEIAEGLEFQQMMMPNNIQIVSSNVDGDKAVLEVKGTRGMEVSKGTVKMIRLDGEWKIEEQSWTSDETTE